MIQIKSSARSSTDTSIATGEKRTCRHDSVSKTGENLPKLMPLQKSYPNLLVPRKVLIEDLKELFPQFSESVISMLHLPPKAVHRGYFSINELKALQTQAFRIHLDIHKDHVSSCSHDDCPTCVSLRQRDSQTWKERVLQHCSEDNKGGKEKQPSGKEREESWRYEAEDEGDLYVTSLLSEREFAKSKDNHLGTHCKRVRGNKKESVQRSPFLFWEKSWKWEVGKVKRSSSDTDLLHLMKKEAAKENRYRSSDDSFLIAHSTPLGSSTSHGYKLSLTPQELSTSNSFRLSLSPKQEASLFRREISPKTKSNICTIRSDHWALVCRTVATNLRWKKEVESGKY